MSNLPRVLWIANTVFPAPSDALGMAAPVVGGWMYGLAHALAQTGQLRLSVASVYPGKDLRFLEIDGVSYVLLPGRLAAKYQRHLEPMWRSVCKRLNPDVIHIHGTEYLHGLACMRSCETERYIVSIQGLVGVCAKYLLAGVAPWEWVKNLTPRDVLRWDTVFQAQRRFARHAKWEQEYLARTGVVVGRTEWDRAHARRLSPSARYCACNETLREAFYGARKWRLDACERHSIFVSQGAHPIKGFHKLLEAVALLRSSFPRIQVRVAGYDLLRSRTWGDIARRTGYGRLVGGLISRLGLSSVVKYLGPLDAEGMIAEYLRAHLFVSPSSIENSPNSIGEAQLLGVPTVASFVGGVPDLVKDEFSGLLYRFEEVEVLAEKIRRVFEDEDLCRRLSTGGVATAEGRHDRGRNAQRTIEIYTSAMARTPKASVIEAGLA